MRVIQYAETSMVNNDRLGLLDAPPSRGTTIGELANAIFLLLLRTDAAVTFDSAVLLRQLERKRQN